MIAPRGTIDAQNDPASFCSTCLWRLLLAAPQPGVIHCTVMGSAKLPSRMFCVKEVGSLADCSLASSVVGFI
jgi:hypothetical protein